MLISICTLYNFWNFYITPIDGTIEIPSVLIKCPSEEIPKFLYRSLLNLVQRNRPTKQQPSQRDRTLSPEIEITYINGNSRGSMGQPGPPGGIITICWTGILNRCGPTKYCGPPAIGGPDGSWGVGAEGCGPSEAAADGLAAAGLPDVSSVTVVEDLSCLTFYKCHTTLLSTNTSATS